MSLNCFLSRRPSPLLCVAVLIAFFNAPASAREGDPIAVRIWPGGMVTIHSHWGLSVAIQGETRQPENPARTNPPYATAIPKTNATVTIGESGAFVLSRPVNQAETTWRQVTNDDIQTGRKSKTPNDIQVNLLDGKAVHIQLDGADLVVPGTDCTVEILNSIPSIDAVIGSDLQRLVEQGKSLPANVRNWVSISATAPDSANVKTQDHNTVAVSSESPDSKMVSTVTWWTVSPQPWQMPREMNRLFVAMEKSCAESQRVFAGMTVAQMNFKPANGTHTPRWNVEHMMGRQLLFFSQMYHEADPSIPVMDLNPAQMPPDYKFANADWHGAEEARQMQRVSDFSRRFAYLLDGYTVDEKIPGSRWPTLQALLKQMERHFSEHTANTEKKFLLPGWPSNE